MQTAGCFAALRRAHVWLGWVVAAWLLMMAATGTGLLFKAQRLAVLAPPCAAGRPADLERALQVADQRFAGRVRLMIPASRELCQHQVIFRDQPISIL